MRNWTPWSVEFEPYQILDRSLFRCKQASYRDEIKAGLFLSLRSLQSSIVLLAISPTKWIVPLGLLSIWLNYIGQNGYLF